MINYKIEVGEDKNASICHCCGKKSCVGHGFVYEDNEPYAVYYVGWSDTHIEKKVTIALAIGEWDDDSTTNDRTCFGIEAYADKNKILFRVIEPTESPWANTDLLGKMLSRNHSLAHTLLEKVFFIVKRILRSHVALRKYFAIFE